MAVLAPRIKTVARGVYRGLRATAAAIALTGADADTTILVTGTATVIVTLPAAALNKGMRVTVVGQSATASGVGLTVDVPSTDTLYGNGFTAAAGKGAVNTQATARAGDGITVQSDGTNWFIIAVFGTWAREA